MVKVADFIPPVKEKLEFEQIKIDTYFRMIHVPNFFLNYFDETFMIQDYTCNNITGNITEYTQELDTVYSCFCNNGDYHQMPTINFELNKRKVQYDMDPPDYMLMPYINYTDPVMSQCIFGIDGYKEDARPDSSVLTFG